MKLSRSYWRGAALAAAAAFAFGAAPALAAPQPMMPPMGGAMMRHGGMITVSASGTVYAKPDMALLQISVRREAPTATGAAARVRQDLPALLAELKKLLPEKDIQTSGWQVGPIYDQDAKAPKSFAAETQLSLKIRQTDQLGAVIDTALAKGANGMGSLSWAVSDPHKLYLKAEARAVADAQQKIAAYAEAAGAKAGRIIRISEQGAEPRPLIYSMRMNAAADTPMEAGESAVTAQIQVSAMMMPAEKAEK